MKKRFFLFAIVLFSLSIHSETHVTATDPGTWSTQVLAPYVGQTVVFDNPIVVCSNTSSSSLLVSPWRMFQPECQGKAGSAEYNETVHINNNCGFTLNGISGYHRCGEKIYNLRAKVSSPTQLTWVSGEWRGNTRADLEKSLPDLGDYRLLVCAFNLENYFMTWGTMGANSYSEHQKQRAKISKALKRINADIYGLVELEKGNAAIEEIVNDLNKNLPGRNYKYFIDSSSESVQKSDFVYDANKVEPIGKPAVTDAEIQYRKKMICFREIATGEKFIYSINHLKSMNTGDEYRRINESRAILDLYNLYYKNANVRENDVLFMGDFNSYAMTDPIQIFMENGMIDLHRAFHADSSYSYMFNKMASYIDHAICNETLRPQITGMAAYTINSDENDKYTYDKSDDNTMFRSSDHDPVLVGLKLDSTLIFDPVPYINSEEIIQGKANSLVIQNAYKSGKKSFYAIYSINGMLQERKEISSMYQEVQLPAAGFYIVYVYYDGMTYQRKMIIR